MIRYIFNPNAFTNIAEIMSIPILDYILKPWDNPAFNLIIIQ